MNTEILSYLESCRFIIKFTKKLNIFVAVTLSYILFHKKLYVYLLLNFVIKHHRGNIQKKCTRRKYPTFCQLSSGWFSKQAGKASKLTSAYLLLVINDQGQEMHVQPPYVIATPRIF